MEAPHFTKMIVSYDTGYFSLIIIIKYNFEEAPVLYNRCWKQFQDFAQKSGGCNTKKQFERYCKSTRENVFDAEQAQIRM